MASRALGGDDRLRTRIGIEQPKKQRQSQGGNTRGKQCGSDDNQYGDAKHFESCLGTTRFRKLNVKSTAAATMQPVPIAVKERRW